MNDAMMSRASGRWSGTTLALDASLLQEGRFSGPQAYRSRVPSAAADAASVRILIVDDDPAVRGLMTDLLSKSGYAFSQAADVPSAWEQLKTDRFDLVISDYEMPGATGIDLLGLIQDAKMDIGFLMLTAHDEIELARHSIALGALDFLTKPFEYSQLTRLIELNLERRRQKGQWIERVTTDVLGGTIRSLVAAVDAKDPYTATHSQRVMELCSAFGRCSGLSPNRQAVLEFSALLHDVGKIAIPEDILRKPGALDQEEWETLKTHPIWSAQIVAQVASLSEVATIILHHHERFDGEGYPAGLREDETPYFSYVIAVADAYEALTSDRAYRSARKHAEAIEVIASNLGTQFDTIIGTEFIELEDLPSI